MQEIRCAVFDIDGTLIERGTNKIQEPVRQAIDTLHKNGVQVIVATGRASYFIHDEVREVLKPDYLITINGACTLHHDTIIDQVALPDDEVKRLINFAQRDDVALGFKCADAVHVVNRYDYFREHYLHDFERHDILSQDTPESFLSQPGIALGAFTHDHEARVRTWQPYFDDTRITFAYDGAFDLFSKRAGKDRALRAVANNLSCPLDTFIGFGDGENDIEFLNVCGIGVAMGNASDSVKQAADYVTDSVQDNGIVSALAHFQLI